MNENDLDMNENDRDMSGAIRTIYELGRQNAELRKKRLDERDAELKRLRRRIRGLEKELDNYRLINCLNMSEIITLRRRIENLEDG